MLGQAIFGRDMLFNVPSLADWKKVGECRQMRFDQNNVWENRNWIDFDYTIGQQVLFIKVCILCKSESRHEESYLLHKCIVTSQSGFNAEIFQNESTLGDSNLTSTGMVNSKR